VPRISTLIFAGPPLELLPSHRDDRFPHSTQKPGSGSRHLYAGRRPGSKQAPPRVVLEFAKPPVSTPPNSFRHPIRLATLSADPFACARLPDPHLPRSSALAFYQGSSRWFEACSCKPASRDPPSSSVQPRGALYA
jgi:hypothetical protein